MSQVEIWGNPATRREFLYAGDLADCLVRALDNFESLPLTMNVGLGFDYPVEKYYSMIAEALNYQAQFVSDDTKPVGMEKKVVDVEKQKEWGWEAKTSLKDGIEKTADFFCKSRITL